jgi:hypothetical protein
MLFEERPVSRSGVAGRGRTANCRAGCLSRWVEHLEIASGSRSMRGAARNADGGAECPSFRLFTTRTTSFLKRVSKAGPVQFAKAAAGKLV